MLKKFLISALFLIGTFCLVFAQDVTLEFEPRYWIADLDSKAKVVESSIGSDFDFKSDLGIGDEDFPEFRVTWHQGEKNKIRLAYTQVDYSGDQNVSRTIEFKGESYTAGSRVITDLNLKYLRFGWIHYLLNLFDNKLKLGSVFELKGIMGDVSLEAPNLVPAISESADFVGGLPTVGAALEVSPIEKINLFAEISGLPAGDYGYFFDAEFGAKLIPIHNFSVMAGYRMIDIKAENDPDFIKTKISGPFISATLRF